MIKDFFVLTWQLIKDVVEDNVVWLDDEFKSAVDNSLYKLERTE